MRNAPHKIEVTGDPVVIDVDGVPEYGAAPTYTTHGWFSILDVEEQPLWTGQKVEASVRIRTGEPIAPGNHVKVGGLNYVVVTTRSNPMHLRAMLRRSE